MLDKQTREQIFSNVITDTKKCLGNVYSMGRLYRLNISAENIFYNNCLLDIINQRQADLNFIGQNGEIYL